MMRQIVSVVAYLLLAGCYGVSLTVSRAGRLFQRRGRTWTRRLLITGRFDNSNWVRAHVVPLSLSGVSHVVIVTDTPGGAINGVRYACPPKWIQSLIGCGPAMVFWMIGATFRYCPDLLMGFHIIPGAITALICARMSGARACYQMTGGPTEIIGGGARSENRLTKLLGRAYPSLERLALCVVAEFDLIAVRGRKAQSYLAEAGICDRVVIITGGIPAYDYRETRHREWDILFVGRLAETKQPTLFIDIVDEVRKRVPQVRAACVGDGPLMEPVRKRVKDLRLEDCISIFGTLEAVRQVMAQAKVFVLPSRTEGLSIALLEAMASETVPVVSDVGELGDLLISGVNGYLIEPNNVQGFSTSVVEVLTNERKRADMARAARDSALPRYSVECIARDWNRVFTSGALSGA